MAGESSSLHFATERLHYGTSGVGRELAMLPSPKPISLSNRPIIGRSGRSGMIVADTLLMCARHGRLAKTHEEV